MTIESPGRSAVTSMVDAHREEPTGPAPRVWHVRVPFAGAWLTSNPSSTGDRYRRSRTIKDWRETVELVCYAEGLPKGITPVAIHADVYYAGRKPVRDKLNLAPTIKAVVDGLTPPRSWTRDGKTYRTPGYGFLPDDSDRHVVENPTWDLLPTSTGQPYVYLTIREVTDER